MSAAVEVFEVLPIQSNQLSPPSTQSVSIADEKISDDTVDAINENDNKEDNPENIKRRRKSVNQCPYDGCNKTFNKPSRLTWHIRLHTGEKPFACTHENCTKSYRTSSHLKRHQETHKVFEERLVCEICKLTLKTRQNLLKHRRRVHEDDSRLRCKECGVLFRKKYSLERHKAMHQGKSYTCDTCQKEFASLSKFNRHLRIHDRKYTCNAANCGAKFCGFVEYKQHCATHEDLVDKRRKKLKRRLQARNRNSKTTLLSCPYEECTRIYYYQSNLNHHVRTVHQGIRKWECDVCKKRYPAKKALTVHIQKIHNVDEEAAGEKAENSNQVDKISSEGEKKKRKERRDAGQPKWSMSTKLAGLKLPCNMEKVLINRDATVKLSEDNFSNQ